MVSIPSNDSTIVSPSPGLFTEIYMELILTSLVARKGLKRAPDGGCPLSYLNKASSNQGELLSPTLWKSEHLKPAASELSSQISYSFWVPGVQYNLWAKQIIFQSWALACLQNPYSVTSPLENSSHPYLLCSCRCSSTKKVSERQSKGPGSHVHGPCLAFSNFHFVFTHQLDGSTTWH